MFFLLVIIPFIGFTQHKSRISAGASVGALGISKDSGLNSSYYLGYNIKEHFTVGVDAMFGAININNVGLKTNAYVVYVEASSFKSDYNPGKVYFSTIAGLGYLEQNSEFQNNSAITGYFGAKINFDLNKNPNSKLKVLFGLKTVAYISRLEPLVPINFFFTYKF